MTIAESRRLAFVRHRRRFAMTIAANRRPVSVLRQAA